MAPRLVSLLAGMVGICLAGSAFGAPGVAGQMRDEPAVLRALLVRAVRGDIQRWNYREMQVREKREPEVHGQAGRAYMARRSYRQIVDRFDIVDFQPPVARVRLAARVFEKRVTNINELDPVRGLRSAPWRPAHIVYLLEGTWRWDGRGWRLRGRLKEWAVPAGEILGSRGLQELLERQMR